MLQHHPRVLASGDFLFISHLSRLSERVGMSVVVACPDLYCRMKTEDHDLEA